MSQENVEIVRRTRDRRNARAFDELSDLFNPEIEIHGPFAKFAGEPYRGLDAVGLEE